MISRRNISKSLFTTTVSNSTRNVLNPISMPQRDYPNITITATPVPGDTTISNVLTLGQYKILRQIHDIYTIALAMRNYDKISPDYDQYLTLLNDLNTINVTDPTMKLLIGIVEKTLIGCMNITAVYENSIYNELQIHILTNRINDILSNKNTIDIIADPTNISGQLTVQKTFKLSKIYSYYIYLFGMPEFGVGFDLYKLKLLQKTLGLFNADPMNQPDAVVTEQPDPINERSISTYNTYIFDTIAAYNTSIVSATNNYKNALMTADNELTTSLTTADTVYNQNLNTSDSDYNVHLVTITDNYNYALTTAANNYSEAVTSDNSSESIAAATIAYNYAVAAANIMKNNEIVAENSAHDAMILSINTSHDAAIIDANAAYDVKISAANTIYISSVASANNTYIVTINHINTESSEYVSPSIIIYNSTSAAEITSYNTAETAAITTSITNNTPLPIEFTPVSIDTFTVPESVQLHLDMNVTILNDKIGIYKDASNVLVLSSLTSYYDTSTLSFFENTITITPTDIKNAVQNGQLVGASILSVCYQNFYDFVDIFFGHKVYLPKYTVLELEQMLVSGNTDDASGVIITNVANTIRTAVNNNSFNNRESNASVIQGWMADDLFYVPDGGFTIIFSTIIDINDFLVSPSDRQTVLDEHMKQFNDEHLSSNISIISNTMTATKFSQTYSMGLFMKLVN
jgi:hypothetical protein